MNSIKMLNDLLEYFKKHKIRLLKRLKLNLKKAKSKESSGSGRKIPERKPYSTEIDEIDVAFIKGVGPKLAAVF